MQYLFPYWFLLIFVLQAGSQKCYKYLFNIYGRNTSFYKNDIHHFIAYYIFKEDFLMWFCLLFFFGVGLFSNPF